MLARERERCLGKLVGALPLPTVQVELSGPVQGKRDMNGARPLTGQRQRLLAPLQGLSGIAKSPKDLGETGEAKHPVMGRGEEAVDAVLLGLVEGEALLQVYTGSVPCSEEEQDVPKYDMGMAEGCRVVETLGLVEHLLPLFPRGLELISIEIKNHQAPQHRQELWGLPPGEWPPLRQAASAKTGSGTSGAGVAASSSTRLSHC